MRTLIVVSLFVLFVASAFGSVAPVALPVQTASVSDGFCFYVSTNPVLRICTGSHVPGEGDLVPNMPHNDNMADMTSEPLPNNQPPVDYRWQTICRWTGFCSSNRG